MIQIGAADWLILPVLLIVIHAVATRLRAKWYPLGHAWRPYFLPALYVKIFGAIFIGLLYTYYYTSGDTFRFFENASVLNSVFSESPGKWLTLLLRIPEWYDSEYYEYISRMPFYHTPANYTVCAVAGVLGMLVGTTYLPMAVLFALVSFTGVWALFRTFARQYPSQIRYVALAILFFPSVVVWGSGLLKDTLCLFGIGWATYGAFRILINGNFSWRNITWTLLCLWLVSLIKIYIVASFIPAVIFWILATHSGKVHNAVARGIIRVFVPLAVLGLVGLLAISFEKQLGNYALDNVLKTSESLRVELLRTSEATEGSAYDLGKIDPTPLGLLAKAPLAINVTLFRPYIWEAKKAIIFINAVESFAMLVITLIVLFKLGLLRFFKTIARDANLQFFILYTLIFAFAVGISTYNFGSLSRYKIPCLPFFGLALMVLYTKARAERRSVSTAPEHDTTAK